jgi:hypothetical protein
MKKPAKLWRFKQVISLKFAQQIYAMPTNEIPTIQISLTSLLPQVDFLISSSHENPTVLENRISEVLMEYFGDKRIQLMKDFDSIAERCRDRVGFDVNIKFLLETSLSQKLHSPKEA